MELVGSDLRRTKPIRRFLEISRQLADLMKIRSLRVGREVSQLHVLGHALAKRGHRRLLCGKREAAERDSIVPQSRPSEKNPALGSSWIASHLRGGQRRITAERFSPITFITSAAPSSRP